jgi:uncharacterized protein (DUF1684 family)
MFKMRSNFIGIFLFFICALGANAQSNNAQAAISEDLLTQHHKEINNFWQDRFDKLLADSTFALNEEDRSYLSFFGPNYAYQVEASVQLLFGETPFQMPTYAGTTSEYIRYAIATFKAPSGEQVSLTLYRSTRLFNDPNYKDYLFVPYLDSTNGEQTYGGGRYLDLSISSIQNGKLTIDFNKSYNPLCAYSTGYRCPIPPAENHLSIPIYAGELKYTGEIKARPAVN